MNRLTALCCGALALCLTAPAFAGFSVGATRVIYTSNMKETSLSVRNTEDSNVYLIRSWVSSDKENENVPFIITPPLFRIEPGQENALRITQTSSALPQDRESVYWVNTLAIPPASKEKNTLQFSINTRIKLFYRPVELNNRAEVEKSYQQVKFSRSGNSVSISNSTPYFVNLAKISINDKEITEGYMVAPKSSIKIENAPAGSKVSWQAINDFGGLSERFTANF